MEVDCDVAVIGAGMAGASLAAELSRSLSVVLIEQEERPGYHATGRSAALYSEIYGNAAIRALSRASREFFLKPQEFGATFATPRGSLHIANADQLGSLEAFHANPDVANSTCWMSESAARDLAPVLRRGYVARALYEEHAYDLDVDAIHSAYLRTLRGNGGHLYCGKAVEAVEFSGGARLVRAGELKVRCGVLANAAGAWADRIADMAGAAKLGLQPLRRTAIVVDAPAGVSVKGWPAVLDAGEAFYFKPDAGRILMSPADETPSAPMDAYPDDLDIATAVDRVQSAADIPVTRIQHSWAGLRTFTPDRSPAIGYDADLADFFWLVGQGGYGIQTAPAISRLAAALLQRSTPPSDVIDQGLDLSDLAPARLQPLPCRS